MRLSVLAWTLMGSAVACAPAVDKPPRSPPGPAEKPAVPASTGIAEIASGSGLLCARFSGGTVACWATAPSGGVDLRTPKLLDVSGAKKIWVVDKRVWTLHESAKLTSLAIDADSVDSPVEPELNAAHALIADGVSCAVGEDRSVGCVVREQPKSTPRRVDLPEARAASDLVLVHEGAMPWLCGRLPNHELSCWNMHGKRAQRGGEVQHVWGGERLCVHQSDGWLSCLRDDSSFERKIVWDRIRRYDRLLGVGTGRNVGCAEIDANRVECWWWEQSYDDNADAGVEYDGELRSDPELVPGLDAIAALSVGTAHACALEASGRLVCWGSVSPVPEAPRSTRMPFTRANAVAIGGKHACAIQNDRAWCWGENEFGQLGRSSMTRASRTPLAIDDTAPVVELALGERHTCLRTSQGHVHCFGDATDGRLGRKPGQSPLVSMVAGIEGATRVRASGDLSCAIDAKSKLWCWGKLDGEHATSGPVVLAELDGASDVSIDSRFVCALIGDRVLCTARKRRNPSVAEKRVAVSKDVVELAGRCVRKTDGSVGCFRWREGDLPELGESRSVDGVGVENARRIWAGRSSGCARLSDGSTRCFRPWRDGELPADELPPIPPSSPVAFPGTISKLGGRRARLHARVCGRRRGAPVVFGEPRAVTSTLA